MSTASIPDLGILQLVFVEVDDLVQRLVDLVQTQGLHLLCDLRVGGGPSVGVVLQAVDVDGIALEEIHPRRILPDAAVIDVEMIGFQRFAGLDLVPIPLRDLDILERLGNTFIQHQNNGGPEPLRQAEGPYGLPEKLLRECRIEGDHRMVSVRAPADLHEIGL
jgi:hypothetical protein